MEYPNEMPSDIKLIKKHFELKGIKIIQIDEFVFEFKMGKNTIRIFPKLSNEEGLDYLMDYSVEPFRKWDASMHYYDD